MGTKKILDTVGRRGPDPRFLFPVRADVRTETRGDRIVLVYPKNFNKFERKLHRIIGGPAEIKRPLDDVGTMLWKMSDGSNNLVSIYVAEQEAFKERVEPVDKVVGGLLQTMLALGLMRLEFREDPGEKTTRPQAERVVLRSPE